MPLIDLKCTKCDYKSEELVPATGEYPLCPKCGAKLVQNFCGKLTVNSVKPHNCSGKCSTCNGCH